MGDGMGEIYQRLGKIEQSLARIDERTVRWSDSNDDFERRIRSLEAWRAWILGAVAVLTPLWSLAMMWIAKKMGV